MSAHELRMDADVYQDRQDTTVSVAVKMRDEDDAYAVFWTTTPWTVPTNFAIVVGADIDYVEVRPTEGKFAGKKFYLGKDLLPHYEKELGENYEVVRELKGNELAGRRYYPVFPYFAGDEAESEGHVPGPNGYTIFTADYVDTVEGTGLVHQAPYGEDDMNTLNAHGIKSTDVLDDGCRFTAQCPDYEGDFVFDANLPILRNLRAGDGPLAEIPEERRAILFQEKSYVHSYPHCWRCATPLIYKPVSSWFVSVTKIKPRLLELNQQINWIPGNVKDGQFGKWLANARDWSISRNRFWGSPIPVWVSDDPKYPRVDVYGSLEELKADFGDYPRDKDGNINMHRPWIDNLVRVNPDDPTGKSHMHRISDVLDCWFESGSMSFAQFHYPFENKEKFEQHFPADYIVEYIGQTRGWFYLLHVMATALFDRPAFKNVICHGIVLGSDGQKMSKHLRNYPDVNGVFDKYGSDAMRWFLMSSPILRGGNLIVTAEGIRDTVRQVMLPVWSSYYFFTLYANAANGGAGFDARQLRADEVAGLPEMDRYLLARTRRLVLAAEKSLNEFAISDACDAVSDFIDVLTNWYIRNTRDRFWNEDASAFNTLYTVLEAFMRVLAPLAPMEAESVWRGLTGGESVHLPIGRSWWTRRPVRIPNLVAFWLTIRLWSPRWRRSARSFPALCPCASRQDPRAPAPFQAHRGGRERGGRQGVRRSAEGRAQHQEHRVLDAAGCRRPRSEDRARAACECPCGGSAPRQAGAVRHQGVQVRRLACRCCVRCAGGLHAVRRPCAGRRRVRADQPRGGGERHRGRRFGLRRSADRWLRDPRHRAGCRFAGRSYARDVIRSVQDARKAADLDIADVSPWC